MQKDLEKIKDKYGEKMAHLCRTLFPTLLETEGLLFSFFESKFEYSKFLYNDIVENKLEDKFKNYIYSLVDVEKKEIIINKTPQELLDEAGYVLYQCKTEEEIQSFKKYYAEGEELCTFKGGRLDRCHVFFAIKKNVDEIRRENFKCPKRQDEYGTSVISIQFARGDVNTLSIKNRYNHRVNNPDATFGNNLDDIILGLNKSFEEEYNLNINCEHRGFEIPGYVKANDGKFYKYNYEINNMYYCPNNIIIDNFEVNRDYDDKSRYIIMEYFILDLSKKEIKLYDDKIEDSFVDGINDIEKIVITKSKDKNNKYIKINNDILIILDKMNRIIAYQNERITKIGDYFLLYDNTLEVLTLPNVKSVGNRFCFANKVLKELNMPNLLLAENYFLFNDELLEKADLSSLMEVGDGFCHYNKSMQTLSLLNLKKTGDDFFCSNRILHSVEVPNLTCIGKNFFAYNRSLKTLNVPNLEETKEGFLFYNNTVLVNYKNRQK